MASPKKNRNGFWFFILLSMIVIITTVVVKDMKFSETRTAVSKNGYSYSSTSSNNTGFVSYKRKSKETSAKPSVSYRHVLNILKGCAISSASEYYNDNVHKFSMRQKQIIDEKFIECGQKKTDRKSTGNSSEYHQVVSLLNICDINAAHRIADKNRSKFTQKEMNGIAKLVGSCHEKIASAKKRDYEKIVSRIDKKEFIVALELMKYGTFTPKQKKELEKLALAKVKPIPASDHRANQYGYMLLDYLNPTDHYKTKIKHYTKVGRSDSNNRMWTVIASGKRNYFTQKQWGGDLSHCFDFADTVVKLTGFIRSTDYITCISPDGRTKHYKAKTLRLMKRTG